MLEGRLTEKNSLEKLFSDKEASLSQRGPEIWKHPRWKITDPAGGLSCDRCRFRGSFYVLNTATDQFTVTWYVLNCCKHLIPLTAGRHTRVKCPGSEAFLPLWHGNYAHMQNKNYTHQKQILITLKRLCSEYLFINAINDSRATIVSAQKQDAGGLKPLRLINSSYKWTFFPSFV